MIFDKYDIGFDADVLIYSINKIINQMYKTLPLREEGKDWKIIVNNLIVEITGMNKIILNQYNLFCLLCKMEGLVELDKEEDFSQFRKTVFDCLSILTKIKDEWSR